MQAQRCLHDVETEILLEEEAVTTKKTLQQPSNKIYPLDDKPN